MQSSVYNYDRFNYWEIYTEELPSRGIFYKKDARIRVRTMSVLEVKFLATYMEATATRICNEILNKCTILENLTLDELLLPDRDYIIFWIRLNTFNTSNGFTITIPHCSTCKAEIVENLSLTQFKHKYLDNGFEPNVYLPDLQMEIPIRIPTYNDSIYNVENELEDVALHLDTDNTFEEKTKFVSMLSALDYVYLKEHIEKNNCGIIDEVPIYCPDCGTEHIVKVHINDLNIFTHFELRDILEKITQIAKYSNLTITNEWSWVEVELEMQIINNMIQEENEANKKQLQNVSSRMPTGATSTSTPKMPSLPSMPHM